MGNVLAFELLYRALVFPLMLWSADRAAALALRLSGYSYVTVGNLAGFLLHPGTILVLLGMAVFAVLLTSLEAACLLEVFQASAYYRREGALRVLLGGFLRLAAQECGFGGSGEDIGRYGHDQCNGCGGQGRGAFEGI